MRSIVLCTHLRMICASTSLCILWVHVAEDVWMCVFGFPGGRSSGIQQPLLKCQSGLTELGKAQAAVLDFSHHPPTPTHTHAHAPNLHTYSHTLLPPRSLHSRPRPDELCCCFLCPSLSISLLLFLSLSLLQHQTRRWEACRRELMALLRYIIYVIVYWDFYRVNSCHKYLI